jgi:phosphatidate phosphatase APP1
MDTRTLRKGLLRVLEAAEQRVDRFDLWVKLRYGLLGTVYIQTYRGHGTRREVRVSGRVLEEKPIPLPTATDTAMRNFRSMLKRFLSAEVPGARLRVRAGDAERVVTADDDGFFEVRLEPGENSNPATLWRAVSLELLWPLARGQREARATGYALVPPEDEDIFGVISDIDDTVLQTGVTNLLAMLRVVLFSNVHARLPFEGVAAFYRALGSGPKGASQNPIFYVSTSPWNLYDLLTDFLQLRGIPQGPLFLKNWGGLKDLLRGDDPLAFKIETIRGILDAHPRLPFVLVGDSGQHDAEVYARVVSERPDRIRVVYIRQVGRPERADNVQRIAAKMKSLGVPMLLVPDTVAAAEHAASMGLISPSEVREIYREDRGEGSSPR